MQIHAAVCAVLDRAVVDYELRSRIQVLYGNAVTCTVHYRGSSREVLDIVGISAVRNTTRSE
ncbi:hypothetical protein ES705_20942 [subsurface metagenome]